MTEAKAGRVIDGRNMEPPEPFVQTMEALEALEPGGKVLLLVRHEPFPLYRAPDLNGFSWQSEREPDGSFAVLIRHKPSSPPE
jgi:uncharacterized protein (DUF2249 family)